MSKNGPHGTQPYALFLSHMETEQVCQALVNQDNAVGVTPGQTRLVFKMSHRYCFLPPGVTVFVSPEPQAGSRTTLLVRLWGGHGERRGPGTTRTRKSPLQPTAQWSLPGYSRARGHLDAMAQKRPEEQGITKQPPSFEVVCYTAMGT